jgi:hypothetical protein
MGSNHSTMHGQTPVPEIIKVVTYVALFFGAGTFLVMIGSVADTLLSVGASKTSLMM